jgi:hypothetical protein
MLRPQHTNGMVNRKDGEKHYIFVSATDNKNMGVVDKSVTCATHMILHKVLQVISPLS